MIELYVCDHTAGACIVPANQQGCLLQSWTCLPVCGTLDYTLAA